MPLPDRVDVVVIGSGFAGCSAAVRLAESGRSVALIEESPRLGGRATSFRDRETGERVDNGQHALFGCYSETYDFLRRIRADHLAPLQRRLTLTMADDTGRVETLSCPDLPAPWHLIAGLLRWRALSLSSRAGATRLAPLLRTIAHRGAAAAADAVPEDQTVTGWLAASGQSQQICDWLWRPLAFAALNQPPEVAAAAPFVRVLGELFAPDPAAAAIGLPTVPLDDLFAAPSAAVIASHGGVVAANTRARVLVDDRGQLSGVRAGDHTISAPVVLSTVPWHAFTRLWDAGVPGPLAATGQNAAALKSSPIVTANLWLDPPVTEVMPAPFVGLVGEPMHWVFHKGRIASDGAAHLSVVASGAEQLAQQENDAIARVAMEQLQRALPGLSSHRLKRAVIVREPRATFSLAPGGPPRPSTRTALPGFYLAGDWTDTGLPGTIEGAVRSGYAAARAIEDAPVLR